MGEASIQAGFKDLIKAPEQTSLVHYALKQMAMDWEWTSAFENNNLCSLPAPFKALLLSYIALYGPDEGVTSQGLKASSRRMLGTSTRYDLQ